MPQELHVYAVGNALSVSELLHDSSWLCKIAYLADIFDYFNAFHSLLEGKSATLMFKTK
jgi:hypothetical protein